MKSGLGALLVAIISGVCVWFLTKDGGILNPRSSALVVQTPQAQTTLPIVPTATTAPPKVAQSTAKPVTVVQATPTIRTVTVNQPMKITALRGRSENAETRQYLANAPFTLESVDILDDSTMIWKFTVHNRNSTGLFSLGQPNAPRPYVLSGSGQKYESPSSYSGVGDLVPGEMKSFLISIKAPTKGNSYKIALESMVTKDSNPNFWNFYLWESPQVAMP